MGKRAQGAALVAVGIPLILLSTLYPQVLPFATVVIDTTPPYVASIVPDGTQSQPGTVYPDGTITITVKDDVSGLKEFYFNLVLSGGQVIKLIEERNLNGIKEKTYTYRIGENLRVGTVYKFVIGAYDMVDWMMPIREFWVRITEKPKYTLTVNVSGRGSVSVSGYGTYTQPLTFDEGTNVTLTAIPAEGWRFVQWTGNPSSSNNPLTVTMNQNRTLTANFEAVPTDVYVTVSCEPANGGTVSPGSGRYAIGSTVQFNARPSTGFEFVKWVWGTTESTQNPVSVTISSSTQSIRAVFRQIEAPTGDFYINGQKATNSITLNTRSLTFSFVPTRSEKYITRVYVEIQGQPTIELVRQPDGRYAALWTAPADGTYSMDVKMDWTVQTGVRILSLTFSIPPPVENRVVENRIPTTFKLYYSCSPPEGGSIDGKVAEAKKGETIRLRAVPNEGYVFDKWQGDIVSYDSEIIVTVEKDMSIIATFKKEEELAPPPVPVSTVFLGLGTLLVIVGALRAVL